jgi:hypothetical protein
MPVTLSNRELSLIGVIVIVVAVGAGVFHDQSIKGVYQSFSSTYSKDANLTSQSQQQHDQIRQLQHQLAALQGLPKVALVHGSICVSANITGTPVAIFFDAQSGPNLNSVIMPVSGVLYSPCGYYTYQAYLGSGLTYGARISYDAGFLNGGIKTCAGVPVILTPTGTDFTSNFTC